MAIDGQTLQPPPRQMLSSPKDDVEVSERQRSSITMIKAVNTVKEAIEEQKVNKGETVEEVGEWGEKIEQVTSEADGNV